MNSETIASEQLAKAAAQGIAIALAAREFSGDLESEGPIVAGHFPKNMFEVTLERDAASGEFAVKNIQPQQSAE
ncbi:hypothetical protein [Streptomyces pseudovenezuelae]|uniref:hypothetical protein n=1 Tax=Streptomyces pseudovenezuelae TaxID=67350 RepID=UPI002E80EFD7|nr:hypothetical protein [Streptomyces pseudovenezuelae]WUA87501.1 hypothetical protein OHO81_09455 [Streptomyces pseudovenezuelae]